MSLTDKITTSPHPTLNQTSSTKTSGKTIGNLSQYSTSSHVKQLTEGQIIKGEITDLRNNEITITLEDNSYLSGQLENGMNLAIGDTAAFKVKNLDNGTVTLTALPRSETIIANSTIQKALDEAGLPKNEKNQAIVKELMNYQMPIHKQSILKMLQLTYTNKNVSISTLVIMSKHSLPITEQTAAQFENYRNGNHQLIKYLQTFSFELSNLLSLISANVTSFPLASFGSQLFSILLKNSHTASATTDSSSKNNNNPSITFTSQDDVKELIGILEPFNLSEEIKSTMKDGTIPLRNLIQTINDCMQLAQEIDFKNMETAKELEKNPSNKTAKESTVSIPETNSEIPKTTDALDHPLIHAIFDKYHDLQLANNELAALLSKEELSTLHSSLEDFPFSKGFKEKIQFGDVTTRDFLTIVKNALTLSDPKAISHLFQSKEFQTVLQKELLNSLTLTPHGLQREQAVPHLYEKIYEQVTEIDKLLESFSLSTKNFPELTLQTGSIKDNLDFMKTLNQLFPYVQLPMKMKDRALNSELYVYTKKGNLKNHPENLSVLLHLDMENLGPLDIHIVIAQNHVNTKFYASEENVKTLIELNIEHLKNSLEEKGFLLIAEFYKRERKMDLVKDFIEKDLPQSSMKRYTFDIRA